MEFRCPDPFATVRAANVRATLEAFKLVPSLGSKLVARHSLPPDSLRPDNKVRVQNWLDALAEIQTAVGTEAVRNVGRAIIENADFPPHLSTVESVLLALDDIYHLNHEGEVGHYKSRALGDGAIEVACETPYPRHFERGLVEGIASHVRLAGGRKYSVQYVEGDGVTRTCTLVVRPRR